MDMNLLPLSTRFNAFIDLYSRAINKQITINILTAKLLTARQTIWNSLNDINNSSSDMLYKLYFFLNEEVDNEVISKSPYKDSLNDIKDGLIKDITKELKNRISINETKLAEIGRSK